MNGKKYTKEDDRIIQDMLEKGAQYSDIAAALNRSKGSMASHIFKLQHKSKDKSLSKDTWHAGTVQPPVYAHKERLKDGAMLLESMLVLAESGGQLFLARYEKIMSDAYMTIGWRAEDGARRKVEHWMFIPALPGSDGNGNGAANHVED